MTAQLTVSSDAFEEGGAIPARHACDGEDVSPPLRWSRGPEETGAYALIVDDPDARGFVHWVVADIPASRTELDEAASGGEIEGIEGRNDFGGTGWSGPCPPSGTHRYTFSVYALREPLQLAGDIDAGTLRAAMEGRVVAEGSVTATYRRGG
ncbi:MAG TPA: YbhB/YbcL family Raf kinase inhibitor-like protein [Candidatus Limnocylindria bacterium]|nr:YbhB/YbcL family Raf kinase inhibitor-like protein [Candidatus Limnocylindria bacterium]